MSFAEAASSDAERLVREWLNARAAGDYIAYHPADGRYSLPPEQTVALTHERSPACLPGVLEIALSSVLDSPRITDAARNGDGVGWHRGACLSVQVRSGEEAGASRKPPAPLPWRRRCPMRPTTRTHHR